MLVQCRVTDKPPVLSMNIDPDHLDSGRSWIHRKERRPWSI